MENSRIVEIGNQMAASLARMGESMGRLGKSFEVVHNCLLGPERQYLRAVGRAERASALLHLHESVSKSYAGLGLRDSRFD